MPAREQQLGRAAQQHTPCRWVWVRGSVQQRQEVAGEAQHQALALGVAKAYVVLQQLGLQQQAGMNLQLIAAHPAAISCISAA